MCNTFEQAKIQISRRTKDLNKTEWIYCPICGNKTRTMIREDTELRNFPLYCPKCKKETIINAKNGKVLLLGNKK
ncbi:MAG: cysteine-rich KTR domain-containing protein [Clostridiales bacterium]|nr:cysteine-rich KTR domain-containing protein [Clostridiales bacterium]